MAKDPAFLFYFQDFLVGTQFMTNEEVGIYIRILCHLADKGKLSKKHILNICQSYDFTEILQSKFQIDQDGYYYNPRLKEEIEKRQNYSESRRKNRKSSSSHKDMNNISSSYVNHMKTYDKHMENENENINNTSLKNFNNDIINDINDNNDNNKIKLIKPIPLSSSLFPSFSAVKNYFLNKNYPLAEAESFFFHYESQGWVSGNGIPISNWKMKAENWHKSNSIRIIDNFVPSKKIIPPNPDISVKSRINYKYDPDLSKNRLDEISKQFPELED